MRYAGVNLLIPTPAQAAHVAAHFDPLCVHGEPWASRARKVPLGSLVWPWGASNWSEAWVLADTARLEQIRPLATSAAADLEFTDGVTDVAVSMWMLAPRPLSGAPTDNQLWLLPLVDDRYWWWLRATDDLSVAADTSWEDFVGQLSDELGTELSIDAVPSAYGTVPRGATGYDERTPDERLPPFIDRVASAVGRRVVRTLGGAVTLQTPAQAAAAVSDNLSGVAPVLAGGTLGDPLLPDEVVLTFATSQDGEPRRDRYSVAVPAPAGTRVIADNAYTVHTTAVAAYVASALTNADELDALAEQWAADWYAWRALRHDLRYAGVYAWEPDGATDLEYADTHTRASSRHDDLDSLHLDAGTGSASVVNNYYFTTHTYEQVTEYHTHVTHHYHDSEVNYYDTVINLTDVDITFVTETVITVDISITWSGDGVVIYDLPIKLYDGLWLYGHTVQLTEASYNALSLRVPATTGKDRPVVVLWPDAALVPEIRGMAPIADGGSGQAVLLFNNSTTWDIEFVHDAVAAPERIYCPESVTYVLRPLCGVWAWHDPTAQAWRLAGQDDRVKVTAGDAAAEYLSDKLTSNDGSIDMTVVDTGAGVEVLDLSVNFPPDTDELAAVTAFDTTPGYLSDKVVSTDGSVTLTVLNPGADEQLDLSVTGGVTAASGRAQLGGAYTCTTSFADTGVSVTLPSAGTYLVTATVQAIVSDPSANGSHVEVKLRNTTAGADVGPGGYTVVLSPVAVNPNRATAGITERVVAAGAHTISLQARHGGISPAGTVEVAVLTYTKLA
jgi:hypothetical protein